MNRSKLIVIIVLGILAIVFIVERIGNKQKTLPPGTHGVIVTEVIQTANYTYYQVDENKNRFWIAVVKSDYKPGDSIYYTQASEQKDFVSKELNRTFPTVFFVSDPSSTLITAVAPARPQPKPQKVEIVQKPDISVTVPKGGITIAEIYKNPENYKGKSVMIRGVVVKLNTQIMGKNWIHIQDGTNNSGKFDLTVTTKDSLVVGRTGTFTGTIVLNKDFGSGYFYDVIMEEAKISDPK